MIAPKGTIFNPTFPRACFSRFCQTQRVVDNVNLALAEALPDYPSVILPAVILIGVAFGLGFSALSLAATDGVADEEQGLAASLFQTSFQVGGAGLTHDGNP